MPRVTATAPSTTPAPSIPAVVTCSALRATGSARHWDPKPTFLLPPAASPPRAELLPPAPSPPRPGTSLGPLERPRRTTSTAAPAALASTTPAAPTAAPASPSRAPPGPPGALPAEPSPSMRAPREAVRGAHAAAGSPRSQRPAPRARTAASRAVAAPPQPQPASARPPPPALWTGLLFTSSGRGASGAGGSRGPAAAPRAGPDTSPLP